MLPLLTHSLDPRDPSQHAAESPDEFAKIVAKEKEDLLKVVGSKVRRDPDTSPSPRLRARHRSPARGCVPVSIGPRCHITRPPVASDPPWRGAGRPLGRGPAPPGRGRPVGGSARGESSRPTRPPPPPPPQLSEKEVDALLEWKHHHY